MTDHTTDHNTDTEKRMSDPIITATDAQPEVRLMAYECKFTVESSEKSGGDFLTNIGGGNREKRVTFEGYASPGLYDALADAIGEVLA